MIFFDMPALLLDDVGGQDRPIRPYIAFQSAKGFLYVIVKFLSPALHCGGFWSRTRRCRPAGSPCHR